MTTTDKTIQVDGGTVKEHDVKIQRGELHISETDTLTDPTSHTRHITRLNTTIVRVEPPSPVSLGNEAPGTVSPTTPTLG